MITEEQERYLKILLRHGSFYVEGFLPNVKKLFDCLEKEGYVKVTDRYSLGIEYQVGERRTGD